MPVIAATCSVVSICSGWRGGSEDRSGTVVIELLHGFDADALGVTSRGANDGFDAYRTLANRS
jgi:hypothetical protein